MAKFIDPPFFSFDFYSFTSRGNAVLVQCPKCTKCAHMKRMDNTYIVQCESCTFRNTKDMHYLVKTFAQGQCNACQRHVNIPLEEKERQYRKLNKECPYCTKLVQCHIKINPTQVYYPKVSNAQGTDPVFLLDYYLLTSLGPNQPIWALNASHLEYLIDYVTDKLRTKNFTGKTASHALPGYIKLAKNREAVLRKLKQLEKKL
ncbi:hypothetical protein [Lysinibacillus parviboronicapiens]|uniref:hypothetical protein n=2 Tax=Lysinibacillus parviboronicapiens TaxID=436516 RepID=UPI000D355DD2|nr:hypothetical protein [Lysinibacillus parviboronicapiens]